MGLQSQTQLSARAHTEEMRILAKRVRLFEGSDSDPPPTSGPFKQCEDTHRIPRVLKSNRTHFKSLCHLPRAVKLGKSSTVLEI